MRTPVYRNLDQPFKIFGFSAFELTILCFLLVGGNELFHYWSFVFAAIGALFLFWMRHFLGDLFLRRLLRFISLPSRMRPHLIANVRKKP